LLLFVNILQSCIFGYQLRPPNSEPPSRTQTNRQKAEWRTTNEQFHPNLLAKKERVCVVNCAVPSTRPHAQFARVHNELSTMRVGNINLKLKRPLSIKILLPSQSRPFQTASIQSIHPNKCFGLFMILFQLSTMQMVPGLELVWATTVVKAKRGISFKPVQNKHRAPEPCERPELKAYECRV